MAMIYCPNGAYNGQTGKVKFVNGIAELPESETKLIAFYEEHGFQIAHDPKPIEEPSPAPVPVPVPADKPRLPVKAKKVK